MNALEVTEWLLRQPTPFTAGLVINRPIGGVSHAGRLFQAAMWREYAMTWHGRRTRHGLDRRWREEIARRSYDECLRRARVALYLARRCRRSEVVQ